MSYLGRSERKSAEELDCESRKTAATDSENKGNLGNFVKEEQMVKILNKKGIVKLFPIQYETFGLIAKGEDVIAKDRTGSGKTLAFALPIITRLRQQNKFKGGHSPRFMVVLPTRELAIQVRDEIESLRYRDQEDFIVCAVYGGSQISEQLRNMERGADIIVGTPGRLIDFLDRGAIRTENVEVLCLDEADQMLKIGFKEQIEKIFEHITKKKTKKIQCLLFSATIPEWIWEISDQYQSKSKQFIDMIKNSNVHTSKTVQHYSLRTSGHDKQGYIGSVIKHFIKRQNGKAIIFCETKREVDRISNSGLIPLAIGVLHGDVRQYDRQRIFRKFKSGEINCLIATNVAARGLDFPEIDLIIQMQPPPNTDAYIHRSGRTGRAGKSGVCVTFFSSRDQYLMRKIESDAKITVNPLNSGDLKPVTADRERGDRGHDRDRDSRRDERRHDERDRHDDRGRSGRDRDDRGGSYRPSGRGDDRDGRTSRPDDRGYKFSSKDFSVGARGEERQERKQVQDLDY